MKNSSRIIRKLTLIVVIISGTLFQPFYTSAQEKEKPANFGIRFTGFVKNDFWWDSRQVFTTREDLFLWYPKNIQTDAAGLDINARPTFNFTAMTARLSMILSGPDAFGAKTSGYIEGDFSGVSNDHVNGLRLRHAWMQLKWKKVELLMGQYWHPLFVPEVFPNVISLNTGAPFQPFIRNPQITVTGVFGKHRIIASVIAQRDNSSDGPLGYSSSYMRNAVVPNVHLQYQFKSEHTVFGVGADYKIIRPRLITDSLLKTNEQLATYAMVAYFKYSKNRSTFRFKTIYGQNLTEHLMLGGYALHSLDSITGKAVYTPTNHMFSWVNFTYGKKIQGSLFLGYLKNFGTSETNIGKYYSRGYDIDQMIRIAPSISFISNKTQLSTELEYTAAAFGKPDAHGLVKNTTNVSNLRLLFTVFYFF
ncbi:MAG: hypothetical protein WCM76_05770 [Bacteroidota bacterium]